MNHRITWANASAVIDNIRRLADSRLHAIPQDIIECIKPYMLSESRVVRSQNGRMWINRYYGGKLHGTSESYDGTQLTCHDEYINGKRDGYYLAWYANGVPLIRTQYVAGFIHGECMCWDAFGNITCREMYSNGNKQGVSERWHSNNVYERREYRNNHCVAYEKREY